MRVLNFMYTYTEFSVRVYSISYTCILNSVYAILNFIYAYNKFNTRIY